MFIFLSTKEGVIHLDQEHWLYFNVFSYVQGLEGLRGIGGMITQPKREPDASLKL